MNRPARIAVDTIQKSREEIEAAPYNPERHVDRCFVCGRGLTQKAADRGRWVHLATDGNLVSREETSAGPVEDSQGVFPVGPECAKRIPAGYAF